MKGDLVRGKECPQCKRETVVYNGNYFCDDSECGWAMEEFGPEYGIVKAYLIQRLKAAQEKGNTKEQQAMSFYLINGGYVTEGEVVS